MCTDSPGEKAGPAEAAEDGKANSSEQGFACQQKEPCTCLNVPISILAQVLLLDVTGSSFPAGVVKERLTAILPSGCQ